MLADDESMGAELLESQQKRHQQTSEVSWRRYVAAGREQGLPGAIDDDEENASDSMDDLDAALGLAAEACDASYTAAAPTGLPSRLTRPEQTPGPRQNAFAPRAKSPSPSRSPPPSSPSSESSRSA